ncbi:MAG: pyridoxal-phosphate dependent enzyme [Cytophagales bacterium]|nr:MAG: pyridoxal-phosphate dependent enzyme [Cytophagales bacterium]
MLVCNHTRTQYPLNAPIWKSDSGGLLQIAFLPTHFQPELLAQRPPSLWRYREALPIAPEAEIVSMGEGFTPLQKITFEGFSVYFKLEFLFPSGSYKDRGATVLLTQAKNLSVSHIVQDSSGNAGCSIACYAAAANINCDIYVPADTSAAKLQQIEMYGANLHKIVGNREATAKAALEAAQNTYYASHVWNPFFLQGTKTMAYEIAEQMQWQAPDTLILPLGNGTALLGAFIGFRELYELGIIKKIPKIIGIQAANCAPAYHLLHKTTLPPTPQKTIAEGIAIAEPLRMTEIIEAIQTTQGDIICVEEEDILLHWHKIAKKGYYVETTTAAIVAGIHQYKNNKTNTDEIIVSMLSGTGLKSNKK